MGLNAGEKGLGVAGGANEETDNRMVNSFVALMSFSILERRVGDMRAV